MVLSALISAAAVGEGQRMSKIPGKSRHRCQVHVLLAGEMLDPGVERFFECAAGVLSPAVNSTRLRVPLQPTTVKRGNGVQYCHAGSILEASQGICLVDLAQVCLKTRNLVFIFSLLWIHWKPRSRREAGTDNVMYSKMLKALFEPAVFCYFSSTKHQV